MRCLPAVLLGMLSVAGLAQAQTPSDAGLIEDNAAASTPTSSSEARGVLRATNQAVLASELSGRITDLPFQEGESFNKGDTLARFDCSAYQAQLNAAQAAVVPARNWRTTGNWRRSTRWVVSRWHVPRQSFPKLRRSLASIRYRSSAAAWLRPTTGKSSSAR